MKRKTPPRSNSPTLSASFAAILVGSWTLIFSIFVQAQNTWRFGIEPGVNLARRVWMTSSVLLAQGQNILVAGLFGALVYLGWRRVSLRIATVGLAILVNLIVLLDQISYRLYFQHFQVEMGDGGVPPFQLLTDSLVAEADWVFYFDFLLLGILFWVIYLFFRKQSSLPAGPTAHREIKLIGATLAIGCGISFCAQPFFKNSLIPVHPLVSVIQSGLFDSSSLASLKSSACTGTQKRSDFYSLWKGLPTPTAKQAALAHQKLLEFGQTRPNIILIVLESVGAISLLKDDGTFDTEVTPTFARLASQGVLFPRVYDLFPGTVRSHVPLHTGGSSITSGSAFQEFSLPYQGPTLTSELSRLGYETALFSAQYMSFENMKGFYERLPFDFRLTPDPAAKGSGRLPELNSWGVDEEAIGNEISRWVGSRHRSKPFFIEFLSLATHHPYSAPGTQSGDSAYERYRKALNYTDSVLGKLFESLTQSGDMKNTLVVVMGDHGQAFGDRHLHNFLHGNFLYEENIRNFILMSAPGVPTAQDTRVAFIGDLAPTLIHLAEGKRNFAGAGMLGQSILASNYSERIRFFHKNITPERWGLVDGNWKYIGARLSLVHPELYDLQTDPFEHINLADQYPERVAEYECRTRQWYLDTQREYLTHLHGLSHLAYTEKDFSFTKAGGPRGLHIGVRVGESEFQIRDHMQAGFLPIAQVDWAPINEEKICELKWISPQNKVYKKTTVLPFEVNRAELAYPGKLPLEPGVWRVELRTEAGEGAQLKAQFVVE